MTILPQALLTLVSRHFVFFSFLTAWHKLFIKNYFKSFRYESAVA